MENQPSVQSTPNPIVPSNTPNAPAINIPPKPEKKSKKWFVIIVILLIFSITGVFGFFAYQNYQFKQTKKVVSPKPYPINAKPSPTPITNPTADWKTYQNEYLGLILSYPPDWILKEQEGKLKPYLTVFIKDGDESFKNEFVIYSEPQPIPLPGKSIEEDSDKLIEWTMSYVPAISYYSPNIISKEKINIDGRDAIKYILQLSNTKGELPYNRISIIFQFGDTGKRTLTYNLEGDNQLILDKILSNVKFADSKEQLTYSSTKYSFEFKYPRGTELYQTKSSDSEDMGVNMIIQNISCDITLIINDKNEFSGKENKEFKANNIIWKVFSYQACGPDECQPIEYYYKTINGDNKFAFNTLEDGKEYLEKILSTFNFNNK